MDQIKRLWEILPHLENTTVRWFAKSLDGNVRVGGYADTLAELRNAIKHNQGLNFYVCPNPSSIRTGVRHSTKDVSHWSWFLIDIDPVAKTDNFDPKVLLAESIYKLGTWLGLYSCPIIIHSGRGMQAWFRLNDMMLDSKCGVCGPNSSDEYNRRIVRIAQRYWLNRLDDQFGEVEGCRIDTTCSDLPRPMRMPGTINVKTGKEAHFVSDSLHVFSDLSTTIVSLAPVSIFNVPTRTRIENQEWQDVFVHLTKKAQNYITQGKLDPGRHETMWHAARSCAEQGLTREATRRALVWGNGRRGEDKALDDAAIEHALNTAYKDLDAEQD